MCVTTGLAAGFWWNANSTTADVPATATVNNASSITDSASTSNTPTEPLPSSNVEPPPVPAAPLSYHDGIMRVAPAVVSVYASNSTPVSGSASASQGSGVIIDTDGIVLTNLHLIDNFNAIVVVLSDGRRYEAKLIGSDAETDLAVVRIDANMLPYAELNEASPLRVGDIVLAIGNPFGVGQTVTQGIVSATRRRIANGTLWQNFIQIDAAINPGNSGGALINPLGQLVGVNTAVFRGDSGAIGIGFSIPADLLAQVVPQIIEHGSVTRGWLGLGAEDLNMFPALTDLTERGAVITSVEKGSPADLTGIQPMDVVVQIGEQAITSATQLLLTISALPPGATVQLALLRSSAPDTLGRLSDQGPLEDKLYKIKLGIRPTVNQLPLDDARG